MLKLVSLFLVLLLAFSPVCYSAAYTITEDQLQSMEQLSKDLDRSIEILNQSSEISIKQLIEVEKKLEKLELLWKESGTKLKAIELLVENYKLQVANLRILYEKSEARNKRLKLENQILKGVIGAGAIWALVKALFK